VLPQGVGVSVNFADLSHHQANVDLNAYIAAGHDRIALKATEGLTYTDPTFSDRWRRAGELDIARVAYHFAKCGNDGAAEYDRFYGVVFAAGLGGNDTLCLDQEDTATPLRAAAYTAEFTQRAAARGAAGMIYTGVWYAAPNGVTASTCHPSWRRLWLSDYNANHDDLTMPLPPGWDRAQVIARQHTDRAAVAGVTGGCDYSRVLRDWLTEDGDDMAQLFDNVDQFKAAVRDAADASQREIAARVLLRGLTGTANKEFAVDGWDKPSVAGQLVPLTKAVTATGTRVAEIASAVAEMRSTVAVLTASQQRLEQALSALQPQTAPVAGDVAVTGTLHLGDHP
jgi:GH25 family lysozyme M1 (1,4-beta-N-acetylmuramidase)